MKLPLVIRRYWYLIQYAREMGRYLDGKTKIRPTFDPPSK